MRIYSLLLIILLGLISVEAKDFNQTKSVKIAFGFDKPPFIFGRTTSKGIETDLVEEIMALEGYRVEVVQMSKYYLSKILYQENDFDAAASISQKVGDGLFYSEHFIGYENYAITRTEDNITINSIDDLAKIKFVAWKNAYDDLGERFYQLFNPTTGTAKESYSDTSSQVDDARRFFAKKVDAILSDKAIFNWHKIAFNDEGHYTFHKIFPEQTTYPVVFRDEKLRDAFNRGLHKIKESGRYGEIINFYFEEDIHPLLELSDILADISGKFLFSIDSTTLDTILRSFFLHPDIMGIEVVSTNPSRQFLGLVREGEQIKEVDELNLKNYSKIVKKSYYLNQGNPLLMGEVVIYYKKKFRLNHGLLVPPIESFLSLTKEKLAKVKSSYKKFNLLFDEKNLEQMRVERSSLLGLLSYQEILFYTFTILILFVFFYKKFLRGRFSHISLKSFHAMIISFELGMIIFLIYEISVLDRTENALAKTHQDQYRMIHLLDLMRQSSNDLSQFARAYSVTHDEIYKEKYLSTFNIREGREERPNGYGAIYWDLDEQTREIRHAKGKHKESLHEIIATLPFTKEELKKIDEAEHLYCQGLHQLEKKVFELNTTQASDNILYSKAYDIAKHQAMLPIDELSSMVSYRMEYHIGVLNHDIANQFKYLLIIGLLFIVGNLFIALLLRKKVITPVVYLTQVIRKFQKGEKCKKRVFYRDEIGIMIDELFKMHQQIEESKREQLKLFKALEAQKSLVEQRIKKELEKNREQQLMILYQNRLAQMGEVLNMVAHQWRQPLNNILLTNEVLVFKYERGLVTDETIKEFQEESNQLIREMSRTIDNFRDFFKPKRSQEYFCLNDVIEHVLVLSKQMLTSSSIDVLFRADKRFCLDGYANELGQAILNIVNNAKDALLERDIDKKEIKIVIEEDEKVIKLSISDNGGGIPNTILNRIFEPYFSTKENKNGTGLGLYMSKMIIEEHMRGKILVSNGTHGVCFTIILDKTSSSGE